MGLESLKKAQAGDQILLEAREACGGSFTISAVYYALGIAAGSISYELGGRPVEGPNPFTVVASFADGLFSKTNTKRDIINTAAIPVGQMGNNSMVLDNGLLNLIQNDLFSNETMMKRDGRFAKVVHAGRLIPTHLLNSADNLVQLPANWTKYPTAIGYKTDYGYSGAITLDCSAETMHRSIMSNKPLNKRDDAADFITYNVAGDDKNLAGFEVIGTRLTDDSLYDTIAEVGQNVGYVSDVNTYEYYQKSCLSLSTDGTTDKYHMVIEGEIYINQSGGVDNDCRYYWS